MSDPGTQPQTPRIALVLPSFAGGGAERVIINLATQFLERAFQVDLVVMKREGELLELVPEHARVIDLACTRFRSVPFAIASYLREMRPDTVIANMWPLTAMSVLAHRLSRAKSRIAVVEHIALAHVPRHQGLVTRALLRATLAISCRLAHARIAVSNGVAEDVARLAGLPRDRIEVIHNPVELPAETLSVDSAAVWDDTSAKRVLSVGRLVGQKNHALLLEAFSKVIKEMDARLVILGEGPLRQALEDKVAALGLGRVVALPGFLAQPGPIYSSADLFVLPSSYEGFGNVIVEALACGTPVVSTDCPSGPREVLQDGEFGTLVPCGDAGALAEAMLQVLATKHDADRLKSRAADFSPRKAAEAYLHAVLGAGVTSSPLRVQI